MCLFIVLLSILYHVSLNSRACFVFAWSKICVSVQLNVCPLSCVCEAGSDSRSYLLIAFLCSVSRVSIFLEACPM